MTPALKLRSLPIIDISPWVYPASENHRGHCGGRASTAAALHSACLTYGFFYLDISSYVDQKEMEELADMARKFFALPDEVKEKLALANQDGARGYQRLRENVTMGKADNHEGLDFYAPVAEPDKTRPLRGENQWPTDDMVSGFKAKYERWVEKMKALGLIVMEAMSVGLGMTREEWLDLKSKVDDSFWVMRVIGYPPLPNDYDGFSCGAHRDYGCLTFLYADPTPNALQVFLSQPAVLNDAGIAPVPASDTSGLAPSAAAALAMTQEKAETAVLMQDMDDIIKNDDLPREEGNVEGVWVSADPLPGYVVCNVGEMWEIWTNGLYKSTLHRVVHRGSNYRVSIPFFFEPNFNALIEPLPAALRLQEDTIQPAYAYESHHSHHPPSRHSITSVSPSLGASKNSRSSLSSEGSESASTGTTTSGTSVGSDSTAATSVITTAVAITNVAEDTVEAAKRESRGKMYTAAGVFSPKKLYEPVVYGEFLTKKVGGNFVNGKGKYD